MCKPRKMHTIFFRVQGLGMSTSDYQMETDLPRLQSYNWIVSSSPAVTHHSPVSSKSMLVILVLCLLENRFDGLNAPSNCSVIGSALIVKRSMTFRKLKSQAIRHCPPSFTHAYVTTEFRIWPSSLTSSILGDSSIDPSIIIVQMVCP